MDKKNKNLEKEIVNTFSIDKNTDQSLVQKDQEIVETELNIIDEYEEKDSSSESEYSSKNFLTKSFKLEKIDVVLNKDTAYDTIIRVFKESYFENNDFNEREIMSDISSLKAYRDYLESIKANYEFIVNCLALLITIVGIFISLIKSSSVISEGVTDILFFLALIVAFFIYRKLKSSVYYKIRVCNKLIYKLEDLREEIFNTKK